LSLLISIDDVGRWLVRNELQMRRIWSLMEFEPLLVPLDIGEGASPLIINSPCVSSSSLAGWLIGFITTARRMEFCFEIPWIVSTWCRARDSIYNPEGTRFECADMTIVQIARCDCSRICMHRPNSGNNITFSRTPNSSRS
jgi:hypothetical protein